jgi:arylsulfatase A-like enzyme
VDRPNILLLFTDQHRLSAVGCYGETPCQTPHIDGLARDGVRFETVYTVCPVCSPARGTVMTGLYPHGHGICSNVHNLGNSVHELPDGPHLLSRRLQEAGYRCGYTGKWHLGSGSGSFGVEQEATLPRTVGFEGQNFPGHGGGGFGYPEYKHYLQANGWRHEVENGELTGPLESTVPYFLASNTIELLDTFREAGDPFFLWHNNWGPHGPYWATREFNDLYRDRELPPWPNLDWPARRIPGAHWNKLHPDAERRTWEDWQPEVKRYYAFASLIDHQFGRILRHLEETGLAETTVVVFTADHGETCGSHGGLTDKGYHHFEETHRIPLIIRFPDGRWAGTVREEFASLADLYPTILDWAGAPADRTTVHGRSLMPLLRGEARDWRDDVVTEFNGVNSVPLTQRTLRWGTLKYGFNCCGPDELYDLESDPWETTNLIDHRDYREIGRDMRARLSRWMHETADPVRNIYEKNHRAYYDGPGEV